MKRSGPKKLSSDQNESTPEVKRKLRVSRQTAKSSKSHEARPIKESRRSRNSAISKVWDSAKENINSGSKAKLAARERRSRSVRHSRSSSKSILDVKSRVESGLDQIRAAKTTPKPPPSSCRSFKSFHLPKGSSDSKKFTNQAKIYIPRPPQAGGINRAQDEKNIQEMKRLSKKQKELDERRMIMQSLKYAEQDQSGVQITYHHNTAQPPTEDGGYNDREEPVREVN